MRLLEEVPLPEGVVEVMLFAVKHYPKDVSTTSYCIDIVCKYY